MKCIACGKDLDEGVNFCKYCGAKQAQLAIAEATPIAVVVGAVEVPEEAPATPRAPEATPTATVPITAPEMPPAPEATPKPKGGAPWKAIVGAVVALALIGGGVYVTNERKKAEAYETATQSYAAGRYQEAAEAFGALGEYEDSQSLAQSALLGVAAQEKEAAAGEDPASWEAAAEAWDQLGGNYPSSRAQSCRNHATYFTGIQLMADNSWGEAIETLEPLAESGFDDVPDLLLECETHLTSDEAESLLAQGRYYDAYVAFSELIGRSYEGLPDFSERAQACIQDFPGNGVVYSNPDYSSTAVPLSIQNGDSYTFYKIYLGDDLVRTVFINPDSSANVSLPSGTYRMNEAHGDLWFGEDDMFGREGSYYRCLFGGEETFELEYGYGYEISAGNGGTSIGNDSIDMDSF